MELIINPLTKDQLTQILNVKGNGPKLTLAKLQEVVKILENDEI